jgi:probable addiction module antidote protein
MTTVFIGGSRHVSRLSAEVRKRLQNIADSGFEILVGDANGADKAIQKHLADAAYRKVTVYCSGEHPRNNIGQWEVHAVIPAKAAKGFHFYAAKDREMAERADFGLMVWDGKSAGTILNILRLVRAGKKAVLLNVPEKNSSTFRLASDWTHFIARCRPEFVRDLRERATPDEWISQQELPVVAVDRNDPQLSLDDRSDEAITADINGAFAQGDLAAVIDLLGTFAKAHGMANVAKEAGLSRESLYRSLSVDGNPEFATILKVIGALGLRLSVSKAGADKSEMTMQAH